jgi:hypothetical protein
MGEIAGPQRVKTANYMNNEIWRETAPSGGLIFWIDNRRNGRRAALETQN